MRFRKTFCREGCNELDLIHGVKAWPFYWRPNLSVMAENWEPPILMASDPDMSGRSPNTLALPCDRGPSSSSRKGNWFNKLGFWAVSHCNLLSSRKCFRRGLGLITARLIPFYKCQQSAAQGCRIIVFNCGIQFPQHARHFDLAQLLL